jgi:DNA-directed RNA polymerase specialized sigma24 family protein
LEWSFPVESSTSLKKHWILTQDAFRNLLACLDSDQERAGQKYENIRRGLITFFECRRSSSPEDHADETINRVARRLSEGKEIYVENPASYFYGIARNVLKEHWESPAPASSPDNLAVDPHDEGEWERQRKEQRLECLERCLQSLARRDQELISAYYQGETSAKIQNRKSLAEKLGLPLNALRLRALRIREKLEECVETCLARG